MITLYEALIGKRRSPQALARGAERPIEATRTVHVLSSLHLLLLPDSVKLVIAWHFCIFC